MLASAAAALCFFALGVLAPGLALQRWWIGRVDPSLVWPLGLAWCAAGYAAAQALSAPLLFPLWLAAALAACVWPRAGRAWIWSEPPASALRAVAPAWGATLWLLAVTQFPFNRVAHDSGDFLLDPLLPFDTTFHVGLARELTLGWPPQVPGLAGFPLGYHLGADLLRAAALDWARVDPFDALSRWDPALGALGLLLILRASARRLGCGPRACALVPWTPLLCDLSWVLAGSPQAHWWADLLRGNLLLSLVTANPAVPALGLALCTLLLLDDTGGGRAAPLLAVFSAAAVPHFKVFLGAHLLLGLLAWAWWRPAARGAVLAAALALAASLGLLVTGTGARSVGVAWAPFDLVWATRDSLDLPATEPAAAAGFTVLWLTASLGARWLGVPAAWSALRRPAGLGVAVALMALSGWPLGLLWRVGAVATLPGEPRINDAAYFVEQSGPLLWLFTARALETLARHSWGRVLGAVLLAASLPSSLHFALKKSSLPPDRIPAARLRAARVAAALSLPGEVVLQRPGGRYPAAPVVFVSRRVAYERFTPYLSQFAPAAALDERRELVTRFFATRDPQQARALAARLGARVVCLYDQERVRTPVAELLRPVHVEAGARVFLLEPGAEAVRRAPDHAP